MVQETIKPPFRRQFLACLYRECIYIMKSPTAYIAIFLVPLILTGGMALIQELIFSKSADAKLAHTVSTKFGRKTDYFLRTCENTPFDYFEKPCVDLGYYLDSKFNATEKDLAQAVMSDFISSNNLKIVKKFDSEDALKTYIGYMYRDNETINALSLLKKKDSDDMEVVFHYSMLRYGGKLSPQMRFKQYDKQAHYLVPVSEKFFESFMRVTKAQEFKGFSVEAWPNDYYNGYAPITYFVGMLTTLTATAVELVLISLLLDDLSHPCTSLYAFLSVSIMARIISWLLISLVICCVEPLICYAVGVLFQLPGYTGATFRDGLVPQLLFTLSLIPLSLIITLLVTPNIKNPALPTNSPIITATYAVGLFAILTMIILAPLTSTAIKIADTYASMSDLEGEPTPFSIKFVAFFLRIISLAIGVGLCSLGVSESGSLAGVAYSEIKWLGIDIAWMSVAAMLILLLKLGSSGKRGGIEMDPHNAVEVSNLAKQYNKKDPYALKDVNLTVRNDEKVFVLGNSAAGKSTLLHCINGIERKFDGLISCNKKIGFVSQYNTMWSSMTVEEHIKLVLIISGHKFAEMESILRAVGLVEFPNRLAKDLSFGMKRRLCLGMALAVGPDILILDEVSSGVDPVSKQLIHEVIEKCKCCIVTTHDLQEAERLSTTLCFVNKGRIVENGPVSELFRKYNIKYQAQLYVDNTINNFELTDEIQKEVQDLGFGRFTCDLDDLSEFEVINQRSKGLSGVKDCRIKPPNMDSLFKQLCVE